MNRFAKKFRVAGSLCVLLNLAALFLAVTERVQENYSALAWNMLDYIQSAAAKYLSFLGEAKVELTSGQAGWVLFFMALPLILSLAAGIWGMIGSPVQKTSSLLAFVVLLLFGGMMAGISDLWPEAAEGQTYCRGLACTWTLACSGVGAVFSVAALAAVPKKMKPIENSIPQVEEIRQEQVEAKYNVMLEEGKQESQMEEIHGVLEGVTGIYAGAQIPLPDGEYILLGRQSDNHLVFEGQSNVSRNHCRIKWDAGRKKYIFRDYSSNGSFANGAEDCLPQNLDLELEPGTILAIGDDNNVFCLR